MRIPLEQGRDFTDRDDANAPRVAIVNQTMAQRYWADSGALGTWPVCVTHQSVGEGFRSERWKSAYRTYLEKWGS